MWHSRFRAILTTGTLSIFKKSKQTKISKWSTPCGLDIILHSIVYLLGVTTENLNEKPSTYSLLARSCSDWFTSNSSRATSQAAPNPTANTWGTVPLRMPLKWPHIQINHDDGKKKLLRRLPLIITEKFESRGIFEELDKLENVKNHKKMYLHSPLWPLSSLPNIFVSFMYCTSPALLHSE